MPIAGLHPKPWTEFVAPFSLPLDFVIALSERAAEKPAPGWKGEPVLAHWSVDEDLSDMFWMLQRRIKIFASLPCASASPPDGSAGLEGACRAVR